MVFRAVEREQWQRYRAYDRAGGIHPREFVRMMDIYFEQVVMGNSSTKKILSLISCEIEIEFRIRSRKVVQVVFVSFTYR